MSVLPLIDALILFGWSSLLAGLVLKVIYVTTVYRPSVFGLRPLELAFVAGLCLLFALTLAARTWVKAVEPELARRRRMRASREDEADEPYEVEAASRRADAPEPYRRRAAGL